MMSMLSNILLYICVYYDLFDFLYLLSSSWCGLPLFLSFSLSPGQSKQAAVPRFQACVWQSRPASGQTHHCYILGLALGFPHYPGVFFPLICFISTSLLSFFLNHLTFLGFIFVLAFDF